MRISPASSTSCARRRSLAVELAAPSADTSFEARCEDATSLPRPPRVSSLHRFVSSNTPCPCKHHSALHFSFHTACCSISRVCLLYRQSSPSTFASQCLLRIAQRAGKVRPQPAARLHSVHTALFALFSPAPCLCLPLLPSVRSHAALSFPPFLLSSALRFRLPAVSTTVSSPSFRSSAAQSPSRGYMSWSTSINHLSDWTPHEQLRDWILDRIRLFRPGRVHLCDGSEQENAELLTNMVHAGTLICLNPALRPNSYVARSTASDVARIEERTFICSENKSDAGFTNNWRDPEEMQQHLNRLFDGCMKGRTMFVIPFCMGPVGSPFSQIGVQITDSPYAAVNMRIMTRIGEQALRVLGSDGAFVPCVHSVGSPVHARSGGQHLAQQRDREVHRPLPGGAAHLVVRQRLRRQRAAGQEVLRAAHRLRHGAGGGLAGRAHAHRRHHQPERSQALHRSRLPLRLRQDQPGHADVAAAGLEGGVRGRRHRLDEDRQGRQALGSQP